jgi:negative regulator of replication initiation
MMGSVPNKPKTPHRTIRVENELWADTMTITKAKGETATEVIRRALETYRDENRDLLD